MSVFVCVCCDKNQIFITAGSWDISGCVFGDQAGIFKIFFFSFPPQTSLFLLISTSTFDIYFLDFCRQKRLMCDVNWNVSVRVYWGKNLVFITTGSWDISSCVFGDQAGIFMISSSLFLLIST